MTTSASVSSIQSRPVMPRSNRPSATYRGISCGPQDAHVGDARVVDGAAVVDVGAARHARGRRRRRAAGWPARASPWAGRGSASSEAFWRGSVGRLRRIGQRRSSVAISIAVAAASAPLLPSAPPAPGEGLVEVVGGEHAEDHGHAGVERDAARCRPRTRRPRSRSAAVSPRITAPRQTTASTVARFGEPLRDERDLERARHPVAPARRRRRRRARRASSSAPPRAAAW